MWRPLSDLSRSSLGPVLELQEAKLLAEQWQCQLYEGQKLLGATVYTAESSSGLRFQNVMAPTQKPSKPPYPPMSYPLPLLPFHQGPDFKLSRPDLFLSLIS